MEPRNSQPSSDARTYAHQSRLEYVTTGLLRFTENAMKSETRELWMSLCEKAAVEQDTVRLLELVKRINDLLEDKERRLNEKGFKTGENENPPFSS